MSVFKHEWHLTALVPRLLYSLNCVYLKESHFTVTCMSLTMHPLLWTNDNGKGYETSNTHFAQWVKLFNSTLILQGLHRKLHIGVQYTCTHPWKKKYIYIYILSSLCFVVESMEKIQTSLHIFRNTRSKHDFHAPNSNIMVAKRWVL